MTSRDCAFPRCPNKDKQQQTSNNLFHLNNLPIKQTFSFINIARWSLCLNENTKADSVLYFIMDLGVLEENLTNFVSLFCL